jgi:hypothetical protein
MFSKVFLALNLCLSIVQANPKPENESPFLTHEQWMSLPQEKRVQWLKEMQTIFTEMAETSDLMAYKNLFPSANRRSPAQIEDVSEETKKLREQRRLEFLKSKGISPEDFQSIHKKVVGTPLAQRNNPDYQKDYATWKAAINYVNQKEDEDRARERASEEADRLAELAIEEADKRKRAESENERRLAEHAKFLAEQKMSKRERKKIREKEQQEREIQLKQDKMRSDFRTSEINYLNATTPKKEDLCLFAGWIINGRPCVGPSQMPNDLKFNGIDNEQLKCETGTYLCNPLLFGVIAPKDCKSLYFHYGKGNSPCLKQVKPLCTSFNGGSPTRECARLSTNSVDFAVELIGENDPQIFNDYRSRFHHLCYEDFLNENKKIASQKNAERLRSDVKRTCAVAKTRLEEVRDKFDKFIPRPPKKKTRKVGTEVQR